MQEAITAALAIFAVVINIAAARQSRANRKALEDRLRRQAP